MSVRSKWICLLVLAASGCGGDSSSSPQRAEINPPFKARVEITKQGYRPASVRILVGGEITFVNVDRTGPHTAETGPLPSDASDSNEFDTHTLTWEEPYTVTFHKPGIVEYHSSFDPEMKGTVEVVIKQ